MASSDATARARREGCWEIASQSSADISEGDQLGNAPLKFTFRQPKSEVHGRLAVAVIKKKKQQLIKQRDGGNHSQVVGFFPIKFPMKLDFSFGCTGWKAEFSFSKKQGPCGAPGTYVCVYVCARGTRSDSPLMRRRSAP